MFRKPILLIVVVLALTTLACGITINLPENAIKVGPLQTDDIEIDYPDTDETISLEIQFGAGELRIVPGSDLLVSGTATYNVEDFAPVVKTYGEKTELTQQNLEYQFNGVPNWDDVINKWKLELGDQPMELQIHAGAYDGDFELGGLALESLHIFSGASSLQLSFSEPNTVEMETLRIEVGASDCKIKGLGNANFAIMDFDGGVGSYTLDFSGDWQQDAHISIDVGASSLTIIMPEGVAANVNLDSGLSSVDASGDWVGSGQSYTHIGEGYELDFNINIGVGSLTLQTH